MVLPQPVLKPTTAHQVAANPYRIPKTRKKRKPNDEPNQRKGTRMKGSMQSKKDAGRLTPEEAGTRDKKGKKIDLIA
jgi:hypothetical protein